MSGWAAGPGQMTGRAVGGVLVGLHHIHDAARLEPGGEGLLRVFQLRHNMSLTAACHSLCQSIHLSAMVHVLL